MTKRTEERGLRKEETRLRKVEGGKRTQQRGMRKEEGRMREG